MNKRQDLCLWSCNKFTQSFKNYFSVPVKELYFLIQGNFKNVLSFFYFQIYHLGLYSSFHSWFDRSLLSRAKSLNLLLCPHMSISLSSLPLLWSFYNELVTTIMKFTEKTKFWDAAINNEVREMMKRDLMRSEIWLEYYR